VKRYRQTLEEVVKRLSTIESSWLDEHSERVIQLIRAIPKRRSYSRADVTEILAEDFDAGLTVLQLALGVSKDEMRIALARVLGKGSIGKKKFRCDPEGFAAAAEDLGIPQALAVLASSPVSWRDILIERLKYGRGSAIKGQKRGRSLEDYTERHVKTVFGDIGYVKRRTFISASGKESTDTADFLIPSREDPSVLIESKGYGATGSKQSDVLPKCERIIQQKRHDTAFLLVTDGVTWNSRLSDLQKLIDLQNEGRIARIYTQAMANELEKDLRQLRRDYSLGK